jgi:hypothetical protein
LNVANLWGFLPALERPQQGREAPSNIREIQEIQGGQEAPHNGGAIFTCFRAQGKPYHKPKHT